VIAPPGPGPLGRLKLAWLSAWPLWALVVFAGLPAVRLLPAGYSRAAVAAPVLFMMPGSLTLGAAFGPRHRPQGMAFVCLAALLGAIWTVFASLALYSRGVLITAGSTYWCLLAVSAVLAVVAEARLLAGRQGRGRRVAAERRGRHPGQPEAAAGGDQTPVTAMAGGYHAVLAIMAGATLLCGGLYVYDHLPRPAPVGYTWIAWTGPQINGAIAVGSDGRKLPFEVVHHQSDTAAFQLSAAWMGTPSQPMAKPMTLSIGPNQTFRGDLFVPPLPDGCTYRVVVALTATRQIDPLTKKPQTWSINADVHDPAKPLAACK
jgi:hypothetical protein